MCELSPADQLLRIQTAILMPHVYDSVEHVKELHDAIMANLGSLETAPSNSDIESALKGLPQTFLVAYSGFNILPMLTHVRSASLRAFPKLQQLASHLNAANSEAIARSKQLQVPRF
jgi:hypothetical protein